MPDDLPSVVRTHVMETEAHGYRVAWSYDDNGWTCQAVSTSGSDAGHVYAAKAQDQQQAAMVMAMMLGLDDDPV